MIFWNDNAKITMANLASSKASGNITAFADGGTTLGIAYTTVTCNAHGVFLRDTVTITGTTNYNGTWIVNMIATNTFKIPTAFIANDATGAWTNPNPGLTIAWASGSVMTAMDVGKLLHITAGSGWTTGLYRIIEYRSIRTLVLETSPGTGLSSGTGHIEQTYLEINDHATDCLLSDVAAAFNTTVSSHTGTALITNRPFNYLALDDLATNGAGTGVSSATGGFTTDMVGKKIVITAGTGFTLGEFIITAYTNANNITVASSMGANKTGGTGNVPYTLPTTGNLYVTALAVGGQAEVLSYTSFQNDGTGLVQFNLSATPLQTFAANDLIQIMDVIFLEPRLTNYYTSSKDWCLKITNTSHTTTDCKVVIDNATLKLKDAKRIFFEGGSTSSTYIPRLIMGTAPTVVGGFDVLPTRSRMIFTPTVNPIPLYGASNPTFSYGCAGFYGTAFVVENYNSTVLSDTAYYWFFHTTTLRGISFITKYSNLYKLWALSGVTKWDWNRVNLTGGSGLVQMTAFSSSGCVMNDVFLNGDCPYNLKFDGSFSTADYCIEIENINLPIDGNGYRIYQHLLYGAGGGGIFLLKNIPQQPLEDTAFGGFCVYVSSSLTVYQSVTRYLRVVDTNGASIENAAVTFASSSGGFLFSGTTGSNGYVNGGNEMTMTLNIGGTNHYLAPPIKKWDLLLYESPTVHSTTITLYSPYIITVMKEGYETIRMSWSVDGYESYLKQEILVRLRQSASAGRDAMGSEFR